MGLAGITVAINDSGNRVVTTPTLNGSMSVVGRGDPDGPQNDFGGGRGGQSNATADDQTR